MDFKKFIFYVLVIYLAQKFINNCLGKKIEKFSEENLSEKNNLENLIKSSISKYYDFNWEGIQQFNLIADSIYKKSNIDGLMKVEIPGDIELEKLSGLEKGTIMAYLPDKEKLKSLDEIKDYLSEFGWAICNGETVKDMEGNDFITPNLTDRLLRGTNDINSVGKTGGSKSISVKNLIPKHTHGLIWEGDKYNNHRHKYRDYVAPYRRGGKKGDPYLNHKHNWHRFFNNMTNKGPSIIHRSNKALNGHDIKTEGGEGAHRHENINSKGNGQDLSNIPACLMLLFIIKL